MSKPSVPKPPGLKQDGTPKSDAEVLAGLVRSLVSLSRRVPKGPLREKADEAWRAAKILEVRGEVAAGRGSTATTAEPVLTLAEQAHKLRDLAEQAASLSEPLTETQEAYVEALEDLVKAKAGRTIWGNDGLLGEDADAYRRLNGRDAALRLLRGDLERRMEEVFVKAVELHERIKGTMAPAEARPKRKAVA
ncbi:MAG: hypothetical protein HYY95_27590 [Candidatus Rokubacteria bacterium]|nr:hypothetical protein [Candidatus Rokubacteria bacterium]MBI3109292.1 hypothetical protein [Candidatus Rokubacteria bacterium]